jgi:beta-N-acetylhexosaminidase
MRKAQLEMGAVLTVAIGVLVSLPLAGGTAQPRLTTPPATAIAQGGASAVLARMNLPRRVGQLFMVGIPVSSVDLNIVASLRSHHVGNLMLTGRSDQGISATRRLTQSLRTQIDRTNDLKVPLFIATDQEGGQVQVLRGPGFSDIPEALVQGSWTAVKIRDQARLWGRQLIAAGVNLDLGPVLDTVPSSSSARNNPPIGGYHRQFGFTPQVVAEKGTAFMLGLQDAGVSASIKHFPGLGRVTANPDTTSDVTDTVTTRRDLYLAPFAKAIKAGVPLVMMSTAYYRNIDPRSPAAFSPTVIKGLLRSDLGFNGVVISDDLANARQVHAWSPAQRATGFIAAGGDMVLIVEPRQLPSMFRAVLSRAEHDRAFRDQVNAAALRVLLAKQHRGLIAAPPAPIKPTKTPAPTPAVSPAVNAPSLNSASEQRSEEDRSRHTLETAVVSLLLLLLAVLFGAAKRSRRGRR